MTSDTIKRWSRTGIGVAFAALAFGCQEVEEPKPVLTQQQWGEVQKDILSEAPNPQHALNVTFNDSLELLGFDVHTPLTPGQQIELTWYWKVKKPVKKNWSVFVHLDSKVKPVRQNLDHVPMEGLYPTSAWKQGQIIRVKQKATLRPDMPNGAAVAYIGLYDPKSPKMLTRMKITAGKGEADHRAVGPELTVVGGKGKTGAKDAPATIESKPRYAVRTIAGDAGKVTVDGKLSEPVWNSLQPARLKPFGPGQKYQTWVKAFATEDALYIAGYMEDKHIWGTLEDRDADTWKQEVLEVFIDTDGDGKDYFEFQLTPNNVIFDANFKQRLGRGEGSREDQINRARAWNMEGLEAKAFVDGTLNNDKDQDKFWSIELKLPFASIPGAGKAPKPGDNWAINFYRFDRPEAKKSYAYAWSTGPRGDFHEVSKFGELRFVPVVNRVRKLDLPSIQKKDNAEGKGSPLKNLKKETPKLEIKKGVGAPTRAKVTDKPIGKE